MPKPKFVGVLNISYSKNVLKTGWKTAMVRSDFHKVSRLKLATVLQQNCTMGCFPMHFPNIKASLWTYHIWKAVFKQQMRIFWKIAVYSRTRTLKYTLRLSSTFWNIFYIEISFIHSYFTFIYLAV